jgi:hypothetical protein
MQKEWLDTLQAYEGKLLSATGDQVQLLVNDLMPRIRLAAMEHPERVASVTLTIEYELANPQGPCMTINGLVNFPDKHQTVKVQI